MRALVNNSVWQVCCEASIPQGAPAIRGAFIAPSTKRQASLVPLILLQLRWTAKYFPLSVSVQMLSFFSVWQPRLVPTRLLNNTRALMKCDYSYFYVNLQFLIFTVGLNRVCMLCIMSSHAARLCLSQTTANGVHERNISKRCSEERWSLPVPHPLAAVHHSKMWIPHVSALWFSVQLVFIFPPWAQSD